MYINVYDLRQQIQDQWFRYVDVAQSLWPNFLQKFPDSWLVCKQELYKRSNSLAYTPYRLGGLIYTLYIQTYIYRINLMR